MKRSLLVIFFGLAIALPVSAGQNEEMRRFGQCLADRGARMYSAWWCPYCFKQIQEFDHAFHRPAFYDTERVQKEFPFLVECAEGMGPGKIARASCPPAVKSVPTWIFADKTYAQGVQDLIFLSAKTGCDLPGWRD